ncbi:hypothetical protein JST56_05735 [Candidatus Dependentiae bacterium]|nr:hypothetical protein [Candidatus Dependentiae bacterium]
MFQINPIKKVFLFLIFTLIYSVFIAASESCTSDVIVQQASEQPKQQQFNYVFHTEIVHADNLGFELPRGADLFAKRYYGHLNQSVFFEPSFITDAKKTREYHLRRQYQAGRQGVLVQAKALDGQSVHCTYFNRKSDKLLIIGEGFTNAREVMSPFIDMFPDYDLVLFDFPGQGLDANQYALSTLCIGVDSSRTQFGGHEERYVEAVVDHFKKSKTYTQVYGLGVCYSAFIFLKSAALRSDLFDKLILDGCWISVPRIVEKLSGDFKLICDPQRGGWKDHWFWGTQLAQDGLMWFTKKILGFPVNETSLVEHLPKAPDIPLLFFHGKDDLMVHRNEFDILWKGLSHVQQKTAVITSNPHVRNHLKQKEVYALISDLFLRLDQQLFIDHLQDVKKVAQFYSNQVLNFGS